MPINKPLNAVIRILALLLLVCGAAQLVSEPAFSTTAVGWPHEYFDLSNGSNNPYEATISPSNVDTLSVAWRSPLAGGNASSTGGPIIVGGKAFVATLSALYAFDITTGTQLWSFPLGEDTIATGIAQWSNLVYVTDIFDHAIYAVDATSGHEVWTIHESSGTDGPQVVGDYLLFGSDLQIHAVRASGGEAVWDAQLGNGSFSFPAVEGKTLYVGALDGKFYAIDLRTGAVLWSYAANAGVIEGSITLSRGTAFYGTTCFCGGVGGYVIAVDLVTHTELWRAPVPTQIRATPSIAGGLIYITSYDGLYAFNAKTGAAVWNANTGGSNSSATVANGLVYASGADGLVRAFTADTGELLWSSGVKRYAGKIAVTDGVVYFGDRRYFYALTPTSPP
jgi:outer membrane protein assembly factor BamB